jgi:hypothetical protein
MVPFVALLASASVLPPERGLETSAEIRSLVTLDHLNEVEAARLDPMVKTFILSTGVQKTA